MSSLVESRVLRDEGLCEYSRERTNPSMQVTNISLKSYDILLQLYAADYGVAKVPLEGRLRKSLENRTDNILKVLDSHVQFRNSAPFETKDQESIMEQYLVEVGAISLFFPDLRANDIRICMAAWIGLMYSIDDLVENMQPDEANIAVRHSIMALQEEGCVVSSPGNIASVVKYIAAFKQHCAKYLSSQASRDFFDSVCTALEGMLEEVQFRHGDLPQDLATYMRIRARTVGVSPLFSLVRSTLKVQSPWSSELMDMERDICASTGLQNDLLGLEKDIRTKERMNAVLLGTAQTLKEDQSVDRDALQMAADHISAQHNLLMKRAEQTRDTLQEKALTRPELASEAKLADVLLLFAERHLTFSASAKRYELGSA
ncbi:isoprenoid synthase domain-containing protein [Aspergillus coremiiformis]|uniref:Isoprenoid synthase domain-containing protein n=1 Tax=Aspergillus coremiiformis TaxID=138285 RepID=A0A5N6Z6Z2_9EURO|nr:isoprenoid synthase domain-containing protein [Aspergillus coremiiformis]